MADPIGLYIGTHSISLVQLGGSFSRPRVQKLGQINLETPIVADSQNIPSLSEPLRDLLRKSGIHASEVHVGVASEASVIRYFQMPKLPLRDRATAIRFEAKKYLPFKLEELVSDFKAIILRSDPNIMRVMFYAVKKELVQQYIQVLKESGLKVASIETGLGSLARMLRRAGQLDSAKTFVLIVVDHDVASIAIARNDLVYLARNVTVLPTAPSEETAPTGFFEALLNETVVSVDYHRRRFSSEPAVGKVFLCGDSIPDSWVADLKSALNLPVEALGVGRGVHRGPEIQGNLTVAFGLALRGFEKNREAINLLPVERKSAPKGISHYVIAAAVLAAVGLGVLYQVKSQPVRLLEQQLKAYETLPPNHLGMAPADMTLENLQQRDKELRGEQAFLNSVLSSNTAQWVHALGHLADLLPAPLWLHQLSYNQNIVVQSASEPIVQQRSLGLTGGAYQTEKTAEIGLINDYLQALNSSQMLRQLFKNFILSSVQRSSIQQVEITEFRIENERGA